MPQDAEAEASDNCVLYRFGQSLQLCVHSFELWTDAKDNFHTLFFRHLELCIRDSRLHVSFWLLL